jgi:hypothetical protein
MFLAAVSLVPHFMGTVRRGQGCALLDGRLALFHACSMAYAGASPCQTLPSAAIL